MALFAVSAVLLLTFATVKDHPPGQAPFLYPSAVAACGTPALHPNAGAAPGNPGPAVFVQSTPAARAQPRGMRLLDLPSLRRLFDALAGQRASTDEGERVAAWAEFSLLAAAVVGDALVGPLAFDDLAAATAEQDPRVIVAPGAGARDGAAYKLLTLGYSARETADVVSGRISKAALDTARKMLMVGRGRERASNYLDSQYKRIALRTLPTAPPLPMGVGPFDVAIQKFARLHGVDAAVVRAVIAVESSFDPLARSRAGAIGLMQLMPATARALRVDPFIPEQNIEGGVRYLSELLEMFGGIELALVAYNGGPGFARRYARGQTALYGETRDYVKQVMARIHPQR